MRHQIWVVVVAADDGQGAGHSLSAPALLQEQLDRAAALARRPRICVVVTQEQRLRLEDPLWFLPASNVFAQPDNIGTAHGILLALLRISECDSDARVMLLPSTQRVRDEGSFIASLLSAAADAASKPENVFVVHLEPDATHTAIVVGPAHALLRLFEPELVAVMREIVERVPDARSDPLVAAGFLERLSLPYLDFHRHVLPRARHRPDPKIVGS